MVLQEFKCKNCASPLVRKSEGSLYLVCPYCNTMYYEDHENDVVPESPNTRRTSMTEDTPKASHKIIRTGEGNIVSDEEVNAIRRKELERCERDLARYRDDVEKSKTKIMIRWVVSIALIFLFFMVIAEENARFANGDERYGPTIAMLIINFADWVIMAITRDKIYAHLNEIKQVIVSIENKIVLMKRIF